MYSHFDTLFNRLHASLDRLAIVPLALAAALSVAVLAAFALEQDTGARAAASLLELDA